MKCHTDDISLLYDDAMNILLLEDDIALNKAIKKVLELDKHNVDTFFNGSDVLDTLDQKYHLYILDINVPNLSGMDILDIILLQNKHAQVIMISSNTDIESLQTAYDIGCVDYIKKPFHIAEIRAKISRLKLSREHLLSSIKFMNPNEVLSKTEKKLLTLLLDHLSQVVTYEMIEASIYQDKSMSMDALRALVRRLRSKLAEDIIVNVIDEGYTIPSLSEHDKKVPEKFTERRMASLQRENEMLRSEREVLLKKSTTDPLTGLYNRAKIEEIFAYEQQQFIQYGDQLSVILLDLDNFKYINDRFGHNTGDKYLQALAETLTKTFRMFEIIGRWGGEEFIIMLPKTTIDAARERALELKEKIRNIDCPKLGERTASFGLAALTENDTLSTFVGRADNALIRAKEKGKNRVEIQEA